MEEGTGRVILTLDQYSELVAFKTKYITLVNAMLQGAELGWRDECLKINVDAAAAVLRSCEPGAYQNAYELLKTKKEGLKDGQD